MWPSQWGSSGQHLQLLRCLLSTRSHFDNRSNKKEVASQLAGWCAKSRPHPSCASIPSVCVEPAFHNSTGEEGALFLNGTQAANNLKKKFVWWSQTSTSEEGAVLFFSFSGTQRYKLFLPTSSRILGVKQLTPVTSNSCKRGFGSHFFSPYPKRKGPEVTFQKNPICSHPDSCYKKIKFSLVVAKQAWLQESV